MSDGWRAKSAPLAVLGVATFGLASTASATTIYSSKAAFLSAAPLLDLQGFEGLTATNTATNGFSVSLPEFTITGSP